MYIASALAEQGLEAPTLKDTLVNDLRMIAALLGFWPYILAVVLIIMAIRLAKSWRTEKITAKVSAAAKSTESAKNLSNLQDIVAGFLEVMTDAGSPGKGPVSLECITLDEARADYWDYVPISLNFPTTGGGWQTKISANNPLDWRAPRWQEVIIMPTDHWAVIGHRYQLVISHGDGRELGVGAIRQGNLTSSGSVPDDVVDAVAQGIEKLLKEHNPAALAEFLAFRAEQQK